MRDIYIIGHRNPDTDSIGSVIGYAEFLNHEGNDRFIPARCGELSAETRFALEMFGREPPLFVESVEPTVSDIPEMYAVHSPQDIPTIDVVEKMEAHDLRNMPLVDDNGALVGLISEHGLTQAYVRRQKIEQLSIAPMKIETLARVLNARILVHARDILEGNVYTAIDALPITLAKLTPNDIAIVGDNEPVQLALISARIAALIIAEGAPVGERVKKAAQNHGVSLLETSLDAFGVGKMINLSLPAYQVMNADVPIVTLEDTLATVKQMVSRSPYRTACVVGEGNRFLGMISRNTFLEEVQKSVILLDHNELTQAVDGIENAEILEIIDHHRIGAITTLKPISFQNIPLGSTSTIIARKFMETGLVPSPGTAGLLLSGILSDTLVLRLSTTTENDRNAVEYLAEIAGVDFVDYGTELIRRGMELEGTPVAALIDRDIKEYNLFGKKVFISQVIVPTSDFGQDHRQEILEELRIIRRNKGPDIVIALFTSIFENSSTVYADAEGSLLAQLGYEEIPMHMPGVMSRKKDFLPYLGRKLKQL